jgi:hypothetical protein
MENSAAYTALRLAEYWKDAPSGATANRGGVSDLIRGMAELQKEVRPLTFKLLTEFVPIVDLAHIVMEFVDGKKRAQ